MFTWKKEKTENKKISVSGETALLCKFVLDGTGKKIGESISVYHDILIIKSGVQFLGVPLKHVEQGEKTLMVKGALDFTKAYELGAKWQKESCREMNHHDSIEKKLR